MLAVALGRRAVEAGYRVYYTTAADLVDDQERCPEQLAQLLIEAALSLRACEAGDPSGCGREGDALAGEAGADRERDREMRLAGAGRAGVALLMLSIRCRSAFG